MKEITEETMAEAKPERKRMFAVKNEQGEYWKSGPQFTDDINSAIVYYREQTAIDQGKNLKNMLSGRKRFEMRLYVVELTRVECE